MNLKILLTVSIVLFCVFSLSAQKGYTLKSPDETIVAQLIISKTTVLYDLTVDDKQVMTSSEIGLKTSVSKMNEWKIKRSKQTSVKQQLEPVIWLKSNIIIDHYNQLQIDFENGLSLIWRMYDNGITWRWLCHNEGQYQVEDEVAFFSFTSGSRSWFPQEDGFNSGNERFYQLYSVKEIDKSKLASLPVLFESNGVKILLTESDLWNYSGMWVCGDDNETIKGIFPKYPKKKEYKGSVSEQVIEREDYIAEMNGVHSFPWRILMIARTDNDLLTNQLTYQLARPSKGDFSWVKPGKAQWDWWHANNLYDVDFKVGMNNETYKYYIDFASRNNIEYILIDAGWSNYEDLLDVSPSMNIETLCKYAYEKDVGIMLWASWRTLNKQLEPALSQMAAWGIKGIKVDFMERDDQEMVNFYERVASTAAKHEIVVNFHGAYKPTGWLRTYPNVLTSEGVYGMEMTKFYDEAQRIVPNNVTIPFIRMTAGPMDYTPGAMNNVQKNRFRVIRDEPMVPGTRCHHLAMYVIYESPLQMLADSPMLYEREPESFAFLREVPTIWQKTVPLLSEVGKYVIVARQSPHGDWFIGGMTDWQERSFSINLNFLEKGKYKIQIWRDGKNANRNARDVKIEYFNVDRNTILDISMETGGGFVARLVKY